MIASDNIAYCWGHNNAGQLGNGTTTVSKVPIKVSTTSTITGQLRSQVSAGTYNTCAIAQSSNSYCWGQNTEGRLGNGTTTDSSYISAVDISGVLSGKTTRQISAGITHTCIVASDNQIYCWGANGSGQLGNGLTDNSSVPVATIPVRDSSDRPSLDISVSIGGGSTCALASNHRLYCWGNNASGQLGAGTTTNSMQPLLVQSAGSLDGKTIQSTSAGNLYTCVIASNMRAHCWGKNDYGQLGNNSTTDSLTPVAVVVSGALNGQASIKQIAAGSTHTCAVASNNKAYCWGDNTYGQLGNNSTASSSVPVAVDTSGVLSGKSIVQITAGSAHTCAIASDNQVYCWGSNANGRLGNNSTTNSLVPVAVNTSGVLSGKTVIQISAGASYVCAIASDNQVYCWGYNGSGRLGNGSTTNSSVPVAVNTSGVLSGKTVRQISSESGQACALASDNQVYCWGNNDNGRLGNGSTVSSSVPVAVNTSGVLSGKTVRQVSAESGHSCALASDNNIYCWGDNTYGQLGNSSTISSSVPVLTTVLPNNPSIDYLHY